jgi:hypothetical protein
MPPIKDSVFWFDDGDTFLQAQSVLFKVHRAKLAEQSSRFSEKITDLTVQDQEALNLDNVATVEGSGKYSGPPISSSDTRALLDYLYNEK